MKLFVETFFMLLLIRARTLLKLHTLVNRVAESEVKFPTPTFPKFPTPTS